MPENGVVIGKFDFERSTKNTHVFKRTLEGGRTEAQYVPKSAFEGGKAPQAIEVLIRPAK